MMENAVSIIIVYAVSILIVVFFHTTPTNQDLRQKAVYFPAW